MTPLSRFLLALALPVAAACDMSGGDDLITVTATVVADAELSTLEVAVVEAGLDDDLAAAGTFTVFAPTDDAFAAFFDALGVSAAEFFARGDLGSILQLHVVAGAELNAQDLQVGDTVTTLNGQTLTVVAVGTGVGLDGEDDGDEADATITSTDIGASNGVIHKINAVLIPSDD